MVKPGYKQTEVGEIPEDWDLRTIGDSYEFKNGLNKEKKYFGYGKPIVNYMDVYSFPGLKKSNIQGKVDVTSDEIRAYGAKKGDVFFTRTSETVDEIGITSTLLEEVKDAVFSGFILRARPKDDFFAFEFQKYCFLSETVRKQIKSTSSYTTRALTNGRLLSAVLVPAPEKKSEQKAIAKSLSDVDELIASLEKLIAKKRDIKTAIMQQLLTGKKRLPGFGQGKGYKQTEFGEIPEDWDINSVFQVTEAHKQGFYTKEKYVNSGVRLVRITDLYNPNIDYESMPRLLVSDNDFNQYKIKNGDFLFARSGAIGRYGIVEEDVDAIFGSYIIRFNFNEDALVNRYFGYLFETNVVWKQLLSITQGSSNININANNIKSLKIPLPDATEQNAISKILIDIDLELSRLTIKLNKVEAIKQGMMQELLTGRTRLIKPLATTTKAQRKQGA